MTTEEVRQLAKAFATANGHPDVEHYANAVVAAFNTVEAKVEQVVQSVEAVAVHAETAVATFIEGQPNV